MIPQLETSLEVTRALRADRPVVALESTIIAHGMAYPDNLQTARDVEAIVRDAGAVPATIAVLAGRAKIGLSPAELERVATDPDMAKASTRDLPYLLATGRSGATTVAATMRLAALAGIDVFATGGIGGVHRGAAESFDISADLAELATTPVTVVSAGVKSILDIPLTLEKLESLSVPVICYGSDEFPAFYSRESGCPAPLRLDSVVEIARVIQMHRRLGLSGGISVACPIPREAEIPAARLQPLIDAALEDATRRGISGKAVTPFILDRVRMLSDGISLVANIALVKNNARIAAEIAATLLTVNA
ncbi:MAG: pseudouridine-5'-phosphate glycosidase [Dongiaceae bacterium]